MWLVIRLDPFSPYTTVPGRHASFSTALSGPVYLSGLPPGLLSTGGVAAFPRVVIMVTGEERVMGRRSEGGGG